MPWFKPLTHSRCPRLGSIVLANKPSNLRALTQWEIYLYHVCEPQTDHVNVSSPYPSWSHIHLHTRTVIFQWRSDWYLLLNASDISPPSKSQSFKYHMKYQQQRKHLVHSQEKQGSFPSPTQNWKVTSWSLSLLGTTKHFLHWACFET